ncbi:hypothetical protein [Dietzia aurantiaca]|uniref:DUF2530 domain-containing protein n=1 Tax=Dietzia aurantiaca TaxID=983873 RepID=A0ABV9PSK0_9ACTN
MARGGKSPAPLSFASLALWVAGAGALGLALTAIVVAVLPIGPVGRAVAALAGIVLTIVAMGVASRRITDRAIRAEYGDYPSGEVADDGDPGPHGLG